jgi:L-fucose mutarotase
MLKNIDPLLSPELLKVLAEMGHGDAVVLVDANFTAASLAQGKPVVRLPGIDMARACSAVLSVFPLDAQGPPVSFMAVSGQPDGYRSPLQRQVLAVCEVAGGASAVECQAVERYAFYEQVRHAYAIVQTGELQTYANFLFRKGVLGAALEC